MCSVNVSRAIQKRDSAVERVFVLICILNRGGIQMSRFVTHLGSGVTVPYVSNRKKQRNLLYSSSFHLFCKKNFHLDVKLLIIKTNTIITLLYYV